MKKLCYFINSDWYFELHWIERAIASKNAGYEIHVISHFIDDRISTKFKALGFICHNIRIAAQSFNVLIFFRSFYQARNLIKRINPDILHCITIKPCLMGGFIAKSAHKDIILSFVGLGRIFSANSFSLKLLRNITVIAYKYIFSNECTLFMFEHDKDRTKLTGLLGIDHKRTIVIDGAGISPDLYKYSLEQQRDTPVVLFASRMLWSKGLGDLIEAKRILSKKNIHFTLNVAGILVEKDKDAIPLATIQRWKSEGMIHWFGHCSDVIDLIEGSNIVALPSVYAEGVPRILLEASSVGRSCIAYDSGGCDSLIINNVNGVIVKSRSVEELAEKLSFLLNNPEIRITMGINGRIRILDKFSSSVIVNKTLKMYHDIITRCKDDS